MLFDPKWKQTELDEAGEKLLRAADYMEKHGWCREVFVDVDGAVCLAGAIRESGSGNYGATSRLYCFLGRDIHEWNDNVCQSKQQAVAALRAAAYYEGE